MSDNIDQKVSDYNKGFLAGQEHTQPSQETKLFMQRVEKTFDELNEKIDKLPTKEGMALANAQLLASMLETVEEKFVTKYEFNTVRTVVYTFIGVVCTFVVTKWLNLL